MSKKGFLFEMPIVGSAYVHIEAESKEEAIRKFYSGEDVEYEMIEWDVEIDLSESAAASYPDDFMNYLIEETDLDEQ